MNLVYTLVWMLLDPVSKYLEVALYGEYWTYRKYQLFLERHLGYITPSERCSVPGCQRKGQEFVNVWVHHPPVSAEVKKFWERDPFAPEEVRFQDSLVHRMHLVCCRDPEHLSRGMTRGTVFLAHSRPTPELLAEYALWEEQYAAA